MLPFPPLTTVDLAYPMRKDIQLRPGRQGRSSVSGTAVDFAAGLVGVAAGLDAELAGGVATESAAAAAVARLATGHLARKRLGCGTDPDLAGGAGHDAHPEIVGATVRGQHEESFALGRVGQRVSAQQLAVLEVHRDLLTLRLRHRAPGEPP